MERIGIREARQNLSRYVKRARDGESFVITDHGRDVAQIAPAPGQSSVIDRLVAERGARRGEGDIFEILAALPKPPPGGPSSQELLDEQREERF